MGSWKKDSSGSWKKSGSSSKKNYTVINGKKVEQTAATKAAPATSNNTWNNDTVTLQEAAQQHLLNTNSLNIWIKCFYVQISAFSAGNPYQREL